VVLSGSFDVLSRAEAKEVLVGRLGASEIFGEMSCLSKGPATAAVVARRPGIVLRLPRTAFDEMVLTHPQILELISELSDERAQSLDAIVHGKAEFTEDGLVLT
jgi:CRP-like cAMP-binding protein